MATRCCSRGPLQGGLMNKIEQVSSDGYQMSLKEGQGLRSHVGGGQRTGMGPYAVMSNASWVMIPCGPHHEQIDTYLWKHYLTAASLAGVKNESKKFADYVLTRIDRKFGWPIIYTNNFISIHKKTQQFVEQQNPFVNCEDAFSDNF